MENYIDGNAWLSSGSFSEKDRYIKGKYRWLSYKGATRISDTVYDDLKDSSIERKYFLSKSGTRYYKYRLKNGFSKDLPATYSKIVTMFKVTEKYRKFIKSK